MEASQKRHRKLLITNTYKTHEGEKIVPKEENMA